MKRKAKTTKTEEPKVARGKPCLHRVWGLKACPRLKKKNAVSKLCNPFGNGRSILWDYKGAARMWVNYRTVLAKNDLRILTYLASEFSLVPCVTPAEEISTSVRLLCVRVLPELSL